MFKPYTDGKQRFAIKTFKKGAASVLVATYF
ncbi:YSIRK-type signal peptide-containing protein [Streptococcus equi]|nr:YSIRK-type signal peptide-containing protein [Streptococcus equi]